MPIPVYNPQVPAIYQPLRGPKAVTLEENEQRIQTEIRRAVFRSIFLRSLELKRVFDEMSVQLHELSRLPQDWDSYGSGPPNPRAMRAADLVLSVLRSNDEVPTRVVPSSEGGIGFCFLKGTAYADIECLNSGEILVVTYRGEEEPIVWEIPPVTQSVAEAVEQIRAHLAA